jgi:RNA polymerase sigma factor (sigma-70 family)
MGAYAELLSRARRFSRRADEAEDLVQTALLAAVEAGRADLSDPANRAWLSGVVRNQAKMAARSAARRASREAACLDLSIQPAVPQDSAPVLRTWLRSLPPSLRAVAAMVLTGHSKREIASALGLAETALRQRVAGVKRAAKAAGIAGTDLALLDPLLLHGRLRRDMVTMVARREAAFGAYDPDGHLILIRRAAHVSGGGGNERT